MGGMAGIDEREQRPKTTRGRNSRPFSSRLGTLGESLFESDPSLAVQGDRPLAEAEPSQQVMLTFPSEIDRRPSFPKE